jgi:glutamate synthase (NADPH/NADH) large chain
MDSPGTYAWILHQDRKNTNALGQIPSFDELFAQYALPDVMARTAAE